MICRANALRLGFGKHSILGPFDLEVPSSGVMVLLGPNGVGKTTFLNALVGERVIQSGELELGCLGARVHELSPLDLSRAVALVPQEPLYPRESLVKDILKLAFLPWVGNFGKLPEDGDPILADTISRFGLGRYANKRMGNLSSGERQKVMLARAVLQRPKLLLLDEPTSHLDPWAAEQIWRCIGELGSKRATDIVLSTHELAFARSVADWVCAFKQGGPFYNGLSTGFEWDRAKELYKISE